MNVKRGIHAKVAAMPTTQILWLLHDIFDIFGIITKQVKSLLNGQANMVDKIYIDDMQEILDSM